MTKSSADKIFRQILVSSAYSAMFVPSTTNIINKKHNEQWPKNWTLWYTTVNRQCRRIFIAEYYSLVPITKEVYKKFEERPINVLSNYQLIYENIVINRIKRSPIFHMLWKIKVYNITGDIIITVEGRWKAINEITYNICT